MKLTAILVAAMAPLAAVPAQSVRLEIEVPPRVTVGDTVPISVRAINDGGGPLELYLMGRPVAFDVTVARADDQAVVWRRLEGQTVPTILQARVLAPGEALELTHSWDQRGTGGELVGAGTYIVTATIHTDRNPLRSPTAPLRIIAREP